MDTSLSCEITYAGNMLYMSLQAQSYKDLHIIFMTCILCVNINS